MIHAVLLDRVGMRIVSIASGLTLNNTGSDGGALQSYRRCRSVDVADVSAMDNM